MVHHVARSAFLIRLERIPFLWKRNTLYPSSFGACSWSANRRPLRRNMRYCEPGRLTRPPKAVHTGMRIVTTRAASAADPVLAAGSSGILNDGKTGGAVLPGTDLLEIAGGSWHASTHRCHHRCLRDRVAGSARRAGARFGQEGAGRIRPRAGTARRARP